MRQLSRRVLLQETLLTAAAAGSSHVLLAGEPGRQSKNLNEPLSVAVIGVRSRSGDHAKAFSRFGEGEIHRERGRRRDVDAHLP